MLKCDKYLEEQCSSILPSVIFVLIDVICMANTTVRIVYVICVCICLCSGATF